MNRKDPVRPQHLAASLFVALGVVNPHVAHALCDETGVAPGNEVVELATPLGAVCIEMLRDGAPLHVDNFLHYIDNAAMVGTFFHRSVPGFILQGGGFILGATDYEPIPATNGTVVNEPCALDMLDPFAPVGLVCSVRGNERGTIALAKVSGDPNSGTTNWFVNLVDNRSALDDQNGGFTVFGRVLGNGMDVFDAIAALPIATQDDLAWMESTLQTSPDFPFPLLQAPLSTGADAVGCWSPALQTSAINDTVLPSIVGIGPDPVVPLIPFHTLSTVCATNLADPNTFVGNSDPALPGGCPFDILSVRTTGPRSLLFPGGTASYWALTCADQSQMLADRGIWLAAFQSHFDQQLVTIDAAVVQVPAVPAFPPLAAALLGAGLLAAAARLLRTSAPKS